MGLSVSIGISPRQTLASWADLAGELEADGVDQLWLIDSSDEIERARAGYDYAHHLSIRADHRLALSDELTAMLAVAGTPEECGQRLAGLLATGIDGCIFPLLRGRRLPEPSARSREEGGRREHLAVLRHQVMPASIRK